MIEITKSPNADSRSADPNADLMELTKSTRSHIDDVNKGLNLIAEMLVDRGLKHDNTKMSAMEEFNAALKSGKIKESEWYKRHITEERHHLKSHVPDDVTLIDVIEHLVDCTMAGLTRSGTIYDIDLSPELLQLAAQNTVELLKDNTVVVESDDLLDEKI